MKFSFGSNLENDLIKNVKDLVNDKGINPNDIEFFLSYPGFKHALIKRIIRKDISLDDFIDHVLFIKENGFKVRYVFNNLSKDFNNVDFILKKLLSLDVNNLTVANIELIEYISTNYKNKFNIGLSTVVRIDSINKFMKFNKYKFEKIILSHGVNYDFKRLDILIKYFNKKGYDIELVGNEFCRCDLGCKECDGYKFLFDLDKEFYKKNEKKFFYCTGIENNIKLLNDSNFIRPEDIKYYEKIGVNTIKLGLRSVSSTNRSINIINAYLSREYNGNIFDLLGDQELPGYPYISNKDLDILSKKFHNYSKTT